MNEAPIVDTNVHLGRWPFRRLPADDPGELAQRLRALGVTTAWAGSFEGVFHRDLAGVNERLVEECEKSAGLFVPFGSLNPTLPAWEQDLAHCHEKWRMPGVRLHPGYHGYALDDERFARLCEQAADRNLIVQISLCLEDERTQSHLARVPHVDPAPLQALVKRLPQLQIQLLNAFRVILPDRAAELTAAGRISFEIAMLEGLAGVERLLRTLPRERLLFGSHAPFFLLESAHLKMRESRLDDDDRRAIFAENATSLVGA